MIFLKNKIKLVMTVCGLVLVIAACSGPEVAEQADRSGGNIQVQTATAEPPAATNEPVTAPVPTATDLPTEIIEPVSPISPAPTIEESTVNSLVETMNPVPGSEKALAAAINDLAPQINVALDQITLVSIEAREWSDASLGCPQEGFMYAQVITLGYLIVLQADGVEYQYHTNQSDTAILCKE
ncbi:MAG: hypothetical protein KDI79_13550 [Anaerolineae bacterium]|nr:hypothetical protein [Anaerolineae bacterium]